MKRLRHSLPAIFILLLAVSGSAQAQAEGSFSRNLAVSGPVNLTVETGSGRIEVRRGDVNSVTVNATITARGWEGAEKVRRIEANPPIEQSGNSIVVGRIDDRWLRHNVGIRYEVTVPQQTEVRARSGSGNVRVQDVAGPVQARTGSGNVAVSNVSGEVDAQTGSGGVTLENVGPRAQASTGSGSIRARAVRGNFEGRTGSGNIELQQADGGSARLSTGSGSIRVQGTGGRLRAHTGSGGIQVAGVPNDDWTLEAGSGSIRVELPKDSAFTLNARTSSGSINVDHPVTVQGAVGRRAVRGQVRGGGYTVAVATGSGNITIR